MESKWAYVWVTCSILLLTLILMKFGLTFDLVNIALLYLLPVLFSAMYGGRGPSFYAAGFGVLAFDFFFVPPAWFYPIYKIYQISVPDLIPLSRSPHL